MDLDKILNEVLNKALIGKDRIKQVNSNEIANFVNKHLEAINYAHSCTELPTKETIISEGEKQIIDWLEENDEREKQAYRIGFRRSFEYVLRLMTK